MRILVTGGAGFIGSNFVRLLLRSRSDVEVLNIDKLTYAGNAANLSEVEHDSRYTFMRGDITESGLVAQAFRSEFDAVVHFAAETHVDRSIEDAAPFLHTNILGTHCLLEATRQSGSARFIHIGTDEVYGSAAPHQCFTEEAALSPSSPYAASKAAADNLVGSYAKTYGLRALILRCTNNYGPFQYPEKLIPLLIANALEGRPLPLYGDGVHERDWLFVDDCCLAILIALEDTALQGIFNISTGLRLSNRDVASRILSLLGKPASLIQFVEDRPGHDRRYSIDSSKFREATGWKSIASFEKGLQCTLEWYRSNQAWLNHARSVEYLNYYERNYARRTQNVSPKT